MREKLRKQPIPDPLDYLDFHVQIKQQCVEIEGLVCSGAYIPRPILRVKVEKGKGLCRQIALPSPVDALILQALSNTLWAEIGKKAPSSNAFYAQSDQPFKKKNPRPDEDEWGYGPISAWMDFQKQILGFAEDRKYVVVTDIANYYDFIVHQFLRNILSDYDIDQEHTLDLLLFMLESMLWRPDYLPNVGLGLPQMDLDAPRLLAHTHLFEVDDLFSDDPAADYARYMDDIDFGVDSMSKAKTVLRDLDLALQTRNLRLNSGKTKILTRHDALRHFRVLDNARLDKLNDKFDKNCHLEKYHHVYRKIVSRLILVGMRKKYFDEGNGDKVLKRLLTFCTKLRGPIDMESFRLILYLKPGLRANLFRCWASSPNFEENVPIVSAFLFSGEAVDDLSPILVSTTIVGCLYDNPLKASTISGLNFGLSDKTVFNLFSRLWYLSRVETPDRLWKEIRTSVDVWPTQTFLSRTVAGFRPLFVGMTFEKEFDSLVRRWGGHEAMSVLEFHESLAVDASRFKAVRSFLEAPNPSLESKISHGKALMILSVLRNKSIPKLQRAKLVGKHQTMMSDAYYSAWFSNALSAMQ